MDLDSWILYGLYALCYICLPMSRSVARHGGNKSRGEDIAEAASGPIKEVSACAVHNLLSLGVNLEAFQS